MTTISEAQIEAGLAAAHRSWMGNPSFDDAIRAALTAAAQAGKEVMPPEHNQTQFNSSETPPGSAPAPLSRADDVYRKVILRIAKLICYERCRAGICKDAEQCCGGSQGSLPIAEQAAIKLLKPLTAAVQAGKDDVPEDKHAEAALAYALWDSENTVRMPADAIGEHLERARSVQRWLRIHGCEVRRIVSGRADDAWVLVPKKLTEEMIDAGCECDAYSIAVLENKKRHEALMAKYPVLKPRETHGAAAVQTLPIIWAAMLAAAPPPPPLGRAGDGWVPKLMRMMCHAKDRCLCACNNMQGRDSSCEVLENHAKTIATALAAAPSPPVQSGDGSLYYDIQIHLSQFMANDTDLMSAMSTIYPIIEARIATLTQVAAPVQWGDVNDLVSRLRSDAEIAPAEHYYWLNPLLTEAAECIDALTQAVEEAEAREVVEW